MTLPLKQSLRKSIIAQREQLSATERAASSAVISAHLLQLPEYQQATSVLGYMNFGAEFFSELWVERALGDGKRLALPKVNPASKRLELYWVEYPQSQLAQGLWGIREPLPERCERLNSLNEVEFALLPGVAFSPNGARLGYGGGFYDKLLGDTEQAKRPLLVAAAYSLQVIEQLPQEATDVKVDCLVTEHEILRCAGILK